VLANSSSGPGSAARHRRPCSTSTASGAKSNFRLPMTSMCCAPTVRMRAASASVCASTSVKACAASRINAGVRCAERSDFSESRALISTIGTPAARAAASRLGQVSVSMPRPMAGRHARRKRCTAKGRSYGR